MRVLVLTISDRASQGLYEDTSGPAIENVLKNGLQETTISRKIISDDPEEIRNTLTEYSPYDVIITSGGTGIGPRDNTPDITEEVCEKLIPGISEYLRAESGRETVNAVLSRASAGVAGSTIIINLPGSEKGARFCAERLLGILPHAKKMLEGGGH